MRHRCTAGTPMFGAFLRFAQPHSQLEWSYFQAWLDPFWCGLTIQSFQAGPVGDANTIVPRTQDLKCVSIPSRQKPKGVSTARFLHGTSSTAAAFFYQVRSRNFEIRTRGRKAKREKQDDERKDKLFHILMWPRSCARLHLSVKRVTMKWA